MSDTFASALWGAELMYQLAEAGGMGINFHGGGYGSYTPIAGTRADGFVARPIYYGMLLFDRAGPGQLIEAQLEGIEQAPLATVYAMYGRGGSSCSFSTKTWIVPFASTRTLKGREQH